MWRRKGKVRANINGGDKGEGDRSRQHRKIKPLMTKVGGGGGGVEGSGGDDTKSQWYFYGGRWWCLW